MCVKDFIVAMGINDNAAARREILESLGYLDFANFARIGKKKIAPNGNAKKPYIGYWIIDGLDRQVPINFDELVEGKEATLSEELIKRMSIELGVNENV